MNIDNINWKNLLLKLTLTDNFSLTRIGNINYPWWFLGCLAQLYLIFYPLYKYINKSTISFFTIFYLYIITTYLWIFGLFKTEYLYLNALGHLPEFTLGIYIACHENTQLVKKRTYQMLLLLSLLFLLLAQYSPWFWIFNGIASTILLISIYKLFNQIKYKKLILYIGEISAYIYILHGFLLRHLFVSFAQNSTAIMKLFYLLIWFILVLFICSILYQIKKAVKKINLCTN